MGQPASSETGGQKDDIQGHATIFAMRWVKRRGGRPISHTAGASVARQSRPFINADFAKKLGQNRWNRWLECATLAAKCL